MERLQTKFSKLLRLTQQSTFIFAKDLLVGFQKRYQLRFCTVHGETFSTNKGVAKDAMPRIMQNICPYALGNIWNAKIFGLRYKQAHGWTFSAILVLGFNMDNSIITRLACCKAAGFEQFPSIVTGSVWRPMVCNINRSAQLWVDYHSNEKV